MKRDTKEGEKNRNLAEQVQKLLGSRERKSLEIARKAILSQEIRSRAAREALGYFAEGFCTYARTQLQYPTLVSFACESVNGDPEKATIVEAAMMLITGGIDVHDDIIDHSIIKGSRETIYGKFGKDIALLVGDALLVKGFRLLYEAEQTIPAEKMMRILNVVDRTFFQLGDAEALELDLRKKVVVTPQTYLKLIKMKASVAEAQANIGALIGCEDSDKINAMANYGRILGILLTLRDDFIDMFEPDELHNRKVNECLPLPVLYALQNPRNRNQIRRIVRKDKMTQEDADKLVEIVYGDRRVRNLIRFMQRLACEAKLSLSSLPEGKSRQNLELLISATMEDLC